MFKGLVLIGFIFISMSVHAQNEVTEEEHFKAAQDTVKRMGQEQAVEYAKGVVDAQIAANPSIAHLSKAIEKFYIEVFQSDEFYDGVASIQMELFTYEELLEIKEMMKLPIFKRYEKIMPQVLQKNMALGQTVVAGRQDRLVELIQKEQARIEKLQKLDAELNLIESY